MSRKNREITNALLEQVIQDAMVRLGNPHSAQNFISDVLTQQERLTIGRRILIARLFVEGYSGAEIADVMPVSPNTLSRIRRWHETDIPYAAIPSPRETTHQSRPKRTSKADYGAPFSFERLRKQYPMHFLLFNLVAELRMPK